MYIYYNDHEVIVKFDLLCTLLPQEGFDGQMTEDNIEIGICNESGFRKLAPSEVKDYLAAIL